MRKVFIISASLALLATHVLAELRGSKHDFSSLGGDPCSYCHSLYVTTEDGLTYLKDVPFITEVYDSDSMNHKIGTSRLNNTDAPLCLFCHDGINMTSKSNNLSDDHPVGFVLSPSLGKDIKWPKVAGLFGPDRNEVWCCTCHDPHGGVPGTKFLVMSNGTSNLCFDCHIK